MEGVLFIHSNKIKNICKNRFQITQKRKGDIRRVNDLKVAILMLPLHHVLIREHVRVVVAQLEEPFDSTGRMLRTLTVVSMGKGHHHARSLHPLSFTGRDKLVDDDLATVCEISELSWR